MLAAIAVLPLVAEHWWESNLNKLYVAAATGLPVGAWFLYRAPAEVANVGLEYASFIILLGALYVISGGIVLRGDLRATPATNTIFLLVGAVLASFMGTTGAAMVMIRPVLKTNSERRHRVHTVVFFIFLVANIGGCLTPLGDPPLFMGYLRGVPFTWTFGLWKEWAFMTAIVLATYSAWDTVKYRSERPEDIVADDTQRQPLRLAGLVNLPLLFGVVALVAFADRLPVFVDAGHATFGGREVGMLLLALASMVATRRELREENDFNFHPINEVAALFVGIFLTMIPALVYLRVHGAELGVTEPWQYFWATGSLSSFLDNTPTYVVFFDLARSAFSGGHPTEAMVAGVPEHVLIAVSLGSVFMGAMSYIGNGPNFMVKAIADSSGVKMPSFGGYMAYSCLILLPCLLLVSVIFL